MYAPASALAVGPSDWHPEILPQAEYDGRLARLRSALRGLGAAHLIVFGGVMDHTAFAWLTGIVPKFQPAFALLGLDGSVRVFFAGAPAMGGAVAAQTWIKDLVPAGGLDKALAELPADKPLALWAGSVMSERILKQIEGAAKGGVVDRGAALDPLFRPKSAAERACIAAAAEFIAPVRKALLATPGLRATVVAGERAGYAAGAEDVRVLASLKADGEPVVIDNVPEATGSGRTFYVAVRRNGYWADAYVTQGTTALSQKAGSVLARVLAQARPGWNPSSANEAGVSVSAGDVGLGLPGLAGDRPLAEGDVVSLVVACRDGGGVGYASALLAATKDGADVLWAGGNA